MSYRGKNDLDNLLKKYADQQQTWEDEDSDQFDCVIEQVSKRFTFKNTEPNKGCDTSKHTTIPFYSHEKDVFLDLESNADLFIDDANPNDIEIGVLERLRENSKYGQYKQSPRRVVSGVHSGSTSLLREAIYAKSHNNEKYDVTMKNILRNSIRVFKYINPQEVIQLKREMKNGSIRIVLTSTLFNQMHREMIHTGVMNYVSTFDTRSLDTIQIRDVQMMEACVFHLLGMINDYFSSCVSKVCNKMLKDNTDNEFLKTFENLLKNHHKMDRNELDREYIKVDRQIFNFSTLMCNEITKIFDTGVIINYIHICGLHKFDPNRFVESFEDQFIEGIDKFLKKCKDDDNTETFTIPNYYVNTDSDTLIDHANLPTTIEPVPIRKFGTNKPIW